MTLLGRDVGEIEALVTDRYLDSLLAGRPGTFSSEPLDEAVRAVSRRLAGDLPRFHPSFRFEERLALRLAEAAAAMRLPLAAGAERGGRSIPTQLRQPTPDPLATPFDDELDERPDGRTVLVGSAVAASLSLAGAAWLAWRRRGSPMARAARAAHQQRARARLTVS
ncbi:MAG TPA: hypothetical protein VKC59_05570 [Candidatus Limnocylindrales bacterium]|nr:hypothetical protein [Candidatus Limnocylindrales bacterium]